ncbi:type II inositol 1,4,5-trisphosphate 5-phosphatase-like, partial [Gastrophryne carolinensis]
MDQSIAIQDTLEKGENCTAVQGILITPDSNESRLVGLVESMGTAAVFLYKHRRMAICAEDVLLDIIVPLVEGVTIEKVWWLSSAPFPLSGQNRTGRHIPDQGTLVPCKEAILHLCHANPALSSCDRFPVIGSDITVRITSPHIELVLQLPFGSHTQEFLQKVDQTRLPGLQSSQLVWLRKYWQRSLPNLNNIFLSNEAQTEN